MTIDLFNKFSSEIKSEKNGSIFNFNSASVLGTNLDRKIKTLKLPNGSSIDVKKWHCHSLRVSKLT